MPEIRDMKIVEVSGVDKAANQRRFLLAKREGGETMSQPSEDTTQGNAVFEFLTGLFKGLKKPDPDLTKIQSLDDIPEELRKGDAVTFQAAVAQSQLSDKFWIATDALRKAVRTTLEDAALTTEGKVAAIATNLDQFKEFVLGLTGLAIGASVAKIEKKGAKLSASRMKALVDAKQLLEDILAEAAPAADGSGSVAKGEDTDMNAEDIKKAVEAALDPLVKRVEKLENPEPDVKKTEGEPAPLTKADLEAALQSGIEPLVKRIDKLESTAGVRKSVDGNETQDGDVKKSIWGGVL